VSGFVLTNILKDRNACRKSDIPNVATQNYIFECLNTDIIIYM